MKAGIGATQVERAIELALAPQYAGRELVGETPVAFGKAGEVTIARIGQRRSGAYGAENLESRPARGCC